MTAAALAMVAATTVATAGTMALMKPSSPKALLPSAMPQEVDVEKSKEAERRRISRLQANQTLMTSDWLQPPSLMKQRL